MNLQNRIVLLTRVPERGKSKTRLIPTLGIDGVSSLHLALCKRTFDLLSAIADANHASVEAHFAGSGDNIEICFPTCRISSKIRFVPQKGESLGKRLQNAIRTAFAEGSKRVVAIGSDCPDINQHVIDAAWSKLDSNDVVIGPATDGGYYLIGLRRPEDEIFEEINWSTPKVLEQTLKRCRANGLKYSLLHSLPDIDEPEDLVHCRAIGGELGSFLPQINANQLSIIIPTFNEALHIGETLDALTRTLSDKNNDVPVETEIILVDGGSYDSTVELASDFNCKVFVSNSGRGRQMNAGAAMASGQTLLFLHADTRLPKRFPALIQSALIDQANVAGAFSLALDGRKTSLRVIETMANLRSSWLKQPYGDQALFFRATDFFRLRGFRNLPLMEDYELIQRAKRIGKIVCLSKQVTTSSRRWERHGVIRTTLKNQLCIIAYHLGVPIEQIAKFYRGSIKPD